MDEKKIKRKPRRWSTEQRRALLDRARSLRSDGKTWAEVSTALDICQSLLFRWKRQEAPEPAFKPVVVTAADTTPVATAHVGPPKSSVTVVTPDGFRIDGLDMDSAAVLVEMLR